MSNSVYIALGSNVGFREYHLTSALNAFPPKIQVLNKSHVFETEPWGYAQQGKFLNQVVEVKTKLEPEALLRSLKYIEHRMGRIETFKNGPRIIDLDILFYGDLVIQSETLEIPHPGIPQRNFFLIPLIEIAPDVIHPKFGKPVTSFVTDRSPQGVKIYEPPQSGLSNKFRWGKRTYIMGILNITPDSFSEDGLLDGNNTAKSALELARKFIAEGADIIDIGAESSRPGSKPISADEEIRRLMPVLDTIQGIFPDITISIDTHKSKVAQTCLAAGAHWINDVWGLRTDKELTGVIARHQAAVVLMHNRSQSNHILDYGEIGRSYASADYQDLIADICLELKSSVDIALKAGIPENCIILDPGIGFGKTVEQNLEIINRLNEIKVLGYPILIGPSRKSFIGKTLNLPVNERVEGTAAAVVVGIMRGADFIRVHDVLAMVRVATMTDAIVR